MAGIDGAEVLPRVLRTAAVSEVSERVMASSPRLLMAGSARSVEVCGSTSESGDGSGIDGARGVASRVLRQQHEELSRW